jgi:hypothetical protein
MTARAVARGPAGRSPAAPHERTPPVEADRKTLDASSVQCLGHPQTGPAKVSTPVEIH